MKRDFCLVVILGLPFRSGAWFAPAAVEASSPAAPLLRSGDKPVVGRNNIPNRGSLRELLPSHCLPAQPHRGQLLPDHRPRP
jgi:hypothetical protein